MPSLTYFIKATPTRASYAECLGKSRAPLGTIRESRRVARAAKYKKSHPPWTTPPEATGIIAEEKKDRSDGAQIAYETSPYAKNHEGETSTPSDAISTEEYSSSEESFSIKDTTPPTVVRVVPGKRKGIATLRYITKPPVKNERAKPIP